MGSGNGVFEGRRLFRTDPRHASLVPLCGLMKAEDFRANNGDFVHHNGGSNSSGSSSEERRRNSDAVRRAQSKHHHQQRAQTPHNYSDVEPGGGPEDDLTLSPPGIVDSDRARLLPQNGVGVGRVVLSEEEAAPIEREPVRGAF